MKNFLLIFFSTICLNACCQISGGGGGAVGLEDVLAESTEILNPYKIYTNTSSLDFYTQTTGVNQGGRIYINGTGSGSKAGLSSISSRTNWMEVNFSGVQMAFASGADLSIGSSGTGNAGEFLMSNGNNNEPGWYSIPSYADDAAAGVGGLTAGMVYQTTGTAASPLNVAGIMMVKQ